MTVPFLLKSLTLASAMIVSTAVMSPDLHAKTKTGADHAVPHNKSDKADKHTPNIVETAVKDGRFTILAGALQTAGLVDALSGKGPLTVFAPTDEAFNKLPEGTLESLSKEQLTQILTSHVIAGKIKAKDAIAADGSSVTALSGAALPVKVIDDAVTISGSTVVLPDVTASNGVIHVIDSVILPEMTSEKTTNKSAKMSSIVEIAVNDGRFTTLVQALQTAGLVDALSGEGPLTVFAPTDDAFAKLPAGTLESLSAEQLTKILTSHVVAGKIMAQDAIAADGTAVTALSQVKLPVKVMDGSVTISGSTVIIPDIKATNGVIHVIDSVIIPQ